MDKIIDKILQEMELDEANDDLGIDREILSQIKLSKNYVTTIQGVRRCGKSILLKQIIEAKKIHQQAIYVNFEDPRFSDILDYKLLDQIVEYQELKSKKNLFYFFDEIQNVQGWEKWLHIQLAKKKRTFVISGSNSKLLSGELGSKLTGRHLTYELFPFSFFEFKNFTAKNLSDYLNLGGFPLALMMEDHRHLLRDYFVDIIERDVRSHVATRSTRTLTQLCKCLFESTGSEISLRNLAKTFDSTADTMKVYVDALEASYIILSCPYYTFSERKSLVRSKKYYPVDLGLRDAVVTKTGLDKGKKIETIVFHHLRKKAFQVYYWKGKKEVDFVIETAQGVTPIQVSWGEKLSRHEEAYQEFKKEYPKCNELLFINENNVLDFLKNFE